MLIKPRAALASVMLALPLLLGACQSQTASTDTVFVSNEASGVVHVLDGASGKSVGALATGARPRGLALSPDGQVLYVAASKANRIEAWSVKERRRLAMWSSGSDPERFAVSPDGKRLYIANEDHSAVSFLDLPSGKIIAEVKVGPEPEGMGVSPDGRLVVATAEASSTVHFIDATSGRLLVSAPVGNRPRGVLFVGGGRQVWISSEQRGLIAVFDAATLQRTGTIDLVPDFPEAEQVQAVEMHATPDGRRVFVSMGRTDRVAEVNPATGKVVRSFATGERTWGLAISPDGKRLYAASGLSGTLTSVDLVSNRVVRTDQVGGRPWGVVAARK
jgi:PQQ-dependent catabolism-associated beta-propeller protein